MIKHILQNGKKIETANEKPINGKQIKTVCTMMKQINKTEKCEA